MHSCPLPFGKAKDLLYTQTSVLCDTEQFFLKHRYDFTEQGLLF